MGSVAPTQLRGSSGRERADPAASAADESSHSGGPESARLTRARQRLAGLISDADGLVAPDDMFPSLGYSPAAAAERFGGQWSSVGLRQLRLVGPIARFIAKVVLDVQASPAACSLQPAARAATATAYARHAHCVHSPHMHRMHALLSPGRRRGGAQAAACRRADRSDLRPRARSHQGRPGALLAPTLALSLANPNPNPNPNQGKAPSSRSDPNPGPDPSPDPKPNPHQALSSRSDLLPAEHLRRLTHAVPAVAVAGHPRPEAPWRRRTVALCAPESHVERPPAPPSGAVQPWSLSEAPPRTPASLRLNLRASPSARATEPTPCTRALAPPPTPHPTPTPTPNPCPQPGTCSSCRACRTACRPSRTTSPSRS